MNHYTTRLEMGRAAEDHIAAGFEDSEFECRRTMSGLFVEGVRYVPHGRLFSFGESTQIFIITLMDDRGEYREFWHLEQEFPTPALREIGAQLADFQASFDLERSAAPAHYYGFGAGFSPQYEKRLCDFLGLEGSSYPLGTQFEVEGAVHVRVPHPFFIDRGALLETKVLSASQLLMKDRRNYLDKLRKAMDVAELLERSLESLR